MVSRILKCDQFCVLNEKLPRAANGEKDADGDLSSLSCVFSSPFFIFLQHTAAALWHCPTGKMTTPSVHVTQFFNTFFFHAVRNVFWKWGEDEGRKKVLKLPCSVVQVLCLLANPMGGSPTLNQLRKPSSLFAALYLIFLRKHSKQERETRLWLKAGLSSCSRRPSAILN